MGNKKWILAALIFCISLSANAQLIFGINVGVNRSKYKFSEGFQDAFIAKYPDNSYNTNALLGLNGELNIGWQLGNFDILTGAGFYQKGSKYETSQNLTYTFTSNNQSVTTLGFLKAKEVVNYVNIPLLGRYRFGEKLGVMLTAGLNFGIGLKGNYEVTFEDPKKIYPIASGAIKLGKSRLDDYSSSDFGFIVNPGLFYFLDDNRTMKLTMNVRWDLGLKGMYTDTRKAYLADAGTGVTGNQKNRSTIFTIGFEICPKVF